MTSTEPKRPAGYRRTLPARDDRLGRLWLVIVAIIFVGIFVLAFLGVPSRLIPDPTPIPLPTPAPTATPTATTEVSPEASPELTDDASPAPTEE
jgi:hypothetical protein